MVLGALVIALLALVGAIAVDELLAAAVISVMLEAYLSLDDDADVFRQDSTAASSGGPS